MEVNERSMTMSKLEHASSLSLADARIEFEYDDGSHTLQIDFDSAYHGNFDCHVDGTLWLVAGETVVQATRTEIGESPPCLARIWNMDVICDMMIFNGPDREFRETWWAFVDLLDIDLEIRRFHEIDPTTGTRSEFTEAELKRKAKLRQFHRVSLLTGDLFIEEVQRRYLRRCKSDALARDEHPVPATPHSSTGERLPLEAESGTAPEVTGRLLDDVDAVVFYADLGGRQQVRDKIVEARRAGVPVVTRRIMGANASRRFVQNGH